MLNSFVLNRLSVFVNIRRRYCRTGWAKIKLQLLFIYSPNSDGFYIFYISQGSVATQLRCDGMFSNHVITNFPQNAPVKTIWQSVNIWQRYGQNFVAYFLGATLYIKDALSVLCLWTSLQQGIRLRTKSTIIYCVKAHRSWSATLSFVGFVLV